MLFEPFADGFIVQFQQAASQDDGEKDHADVDDDVHPEGCRERVLDAVKDFVENGEV